MYGNEQSGEAEEALRAADACLQGKQFVAAQAHYRRFLAQHPRHAQAWHSLGLACYQAGDAGGAAAAMAKAAGLSPENAVYLGNLGVALAACGQHGQAVACYQTALRLNPADRGALYNLGNAYRVLNQLDAAEASYRRALAVDDRQPVVWNNLGEVLRTQGRFAEAVDCYRKTLAAQPDNVDTWLNLGLVLAASGLQPQANQCYEQILARAPLYAAAVDALFDDECRRCDWAGRSRRLERLLRVVAAGGKSPRPFVFLHATDSASSQLQCARHYINHHYPPARPLAAGQRHAHPKIRLAYLSADFCEHAVTHLLVGVVEHHDRQRFEVYGLALAAGDQTASGRRIRAAFGDRFIDVSGRGDDEVARLLVELEIDIAVDLMGLTKGCRPAIFSRRPAPVQVNYLGFPGTMGASYIDYIIADRFLIPEHSQGGYSEKIAYLPECFQANDDRRHRDGGRFSRAELGLPEQAFVFCSFNSNHKITPEFFDCWLRILAQVPDSVLWLVCYNGEAAQNLRQVADKAGLAPGRLVFARKMPYADHLSRFAMADLFLDTLPFNAGATASDALWSGVPVLTCVGDAFAARMAGSLLMAVGLPELVTYNLDDYQDMAVRLAADRRFYQHIRARLATNRLRGPLFNTSRFTRHLEQAYAAMWDTHQRGEQPASFAVPALPGLDWPGAAPVGAGLAGPPPAPSQPAQLAAKVARNSACPCGSGKKFKKCCYLRS